MFDNEVELFLGKPLGIAEQRIDGGTALLEIETGTTLIERGIDETEHYIPWERN